ncbi:Bystin-domain-containing protein [Cylindrobasidium torrendii FP15055 ss-10]|uniref:Bystin-domain-containing protein n=1 Tax=Cylindrobasidium torrendii FP15055 ss-10 TaxID=1314674 RepID=A0A0D7BNL8_9AGAR|nr:Bystin-domain-containing protein [Cylindrobasidium torrendii FP15055 ss-10]
MPRVQKPSKSRHDPLHVQLEGDNEVAKFGRVSQIAKRRKSANQDGAAEEEDEVILDPKTSKRIFELARNQREELGLDGKDEMPEDEPSTSSFQQPRMDLDDDDEDEDDDDLRGVADEAEEEIFEIDEGDVEALEALLPANRGERQTLADLIFSKIDAAESHQNAAVIQRVKQDPNNMDPTLGLDPRVVEMYTKAGMLLKGYRSGPLPKPVKVIPSLPAWARMLALTSPEDWSPHAVFATTRIFISSMKPDQAQLFLNKVVLESVRNDIQENKKLNVHHYAALKRGLYKPGAFFKGVIFPLLDDGCTLKEAAIVASVLARTKIPVLHSSAALLRIADMEYSGPNSLFIRVLIDKKYELPYKVVDSIVYHFIRLSNTYKASKRGDADKLPVLWHQSLLVFVQRYASDLTPDQKDALLDVIRATPHPQIGPEVRRELITSVVRGAPRDEVEDVEMA